MAYANPGPSTSVQQNLSPGQSVTWNSPAGVDIVRPDGTLLRVQPSFTNFSTATVSAGYAADTYLAGSNITFSNTPIAGTRYRCVFDMVKTAAGTAAFAVTLRYGALGTTADTSIIAFSFTAGTAAADTGLIVIDAHFRTAGSGTSAVLVANAMLTHSLAATGLTTLGASGNAQIITVSSGFDSTPANSILGISVNGGTSFSGTNTLVESQASAVF